MIHSSRFQKMQNLWSDALKHARTTVYDAMLLEQVLRLAFYSACIGWIFYTAEPGNLFTLPYFFNEAFKCLLNLFVKEQWLDDSRLAGGVLAHCIADWVLWIVTHCVILLKCPDLSRSVLAFTWLSLAEDYARFYLTAMSAHQWCKQQIKLLEQHGPHAVILSWFGDSVSIRLSEVQHTTPPGEAPTAA